LLLQHPLERGQAKGTADLLRLSLSRCHWLIGEAFDPLVLSQALAGADRCNLLLYPEAAEQVGAVARPKVLDAAVVPSRVRLVVLDATWRKSRKLLHLNPLLQQLPRLALQQPAPSRYAKLRRAQQAHQRSTLEATVMALQMLEGQASRYEPLLMALDGFVAQGADWAAGLAAD
jgi:DTW domain-containing protein YfiP